MRAQATPRPVVVMAQTVYPARYAVRVLADVQLSQIPFSFEPNGVPRRAVPMRLQRRVASRQFGDATALRAKREP
jgi:hypothetical protein